MAARTAKSRFNCACSVSWVTALAGLLVSCSGEPFSSGTDHSSTGGSDVSASSPTGGSGAGQAGGSASTGGGVGTGGTTPTASAACQQNSDCTICRYDHSISSLSECYCAACETKPMTRDQCDRNRSQWDRYCSQVDLVCPAIACISPGNALCNDAVCVAQVSTN